MKELSVGFVGAGFSANLHASGLRSVSGVPVRLAGVAASSTDRAAAFAARHGVANVYASYDDLLADPAIDAVCVCVPNVLHEPVVLAATAAGKHVVCEKPLTGAFGESPLTGTARAHDELERATESVARIEDAVTAAGTTFCYAENWVYAPALTKIERLLELSRGAVLDIRAEESHSGSHAARTRRRDTAGGGALLGLGAHPIGAALHLKQFEAGLRGTGAGRVVSVTAEVAELHDTAAARASGPHGWLVADWHDVETWATTVIGFGDGTKAVISASFQMLGGIRNTLEAYTTSAVFKANMTPNDSLEVYTPDADAFGDEYLHEKLESRTGWMSVSPDEDWVRGYPQEMQDFVESIALGRQPASGLALAGDVVRVVYASYLSAQEGRRISLA